MRTLVHLSDLHFGRVDRALVAPLLAAVRTLKPDLVAVSGDLTQRARTGQFIEARAFLDALPAPVIVVPGNHDVPLYNPLARFFRPLAKYRRYVTADLEPFFADGEIAVLGLNTARSLTIKHGRINPEQLRRIRSHFEGMDDAITKILVTHHPFDLPDAHDPSDLVGRARLAMRALALCRIDVLLAGHLHVSHAGHTATRYRIAGYSALVIGAGTALSDRRRREHNSFNVLRIEHPRVALGRHAWNPESGRFEPLAEDCFEHRSEGWKPSRDRPSAGAS
jgi:3',5'-cyclic AMP phosphodiesterase CpdA